MKISLATGGLFLRKRTLAPLASVAALAFTLGCGSGGSTPAQMAEPTLPPQTGVALTLLSTETFTNSTSQHATEVEAHAFANGSTVVSAFQVGRISSGGGADIGFATSYDAGATWTNGFLPGTTIFEGGSYQAISDPNVAYDAAHGVWLISALPITTTDKVSVSRSTDGIAWGNPVIVNTTLDADKNWIACDSTPTSPFYGHCYVEWDDPSNQGRIWMSTSTDGGLTWGPGQNTGNLSQGIGGQPIVQPNGTVVVPIEAWTGASMLAFTSIDGGNTWNSAVTISSITDHLVAGSLRTSPLPAAAVDSGGTVYVVWQDCRFRASCASNDLILSTSTDGNTWTAPTRIPIDDTSSSADHFIPGLGVEPGTSGSSAHLGLTYYYYSSTNCTSDCQLNVGFTSSLDGGVTWSAPTMVIGPMLPSWLPNTFSGFMVGDYTTTVFANGKAYGVFASATANVGTLFDEPMYTMAGGLALANRLGVSSAAWEPPLANARSDHPPRQFYDQEHRYPIAPQP
jgi:hypothetical protein